MAGRRQTAVDLDRLFRAHATSLLRLAVVLTGDRPLGEELVQEAFVRLARTGRAPREGAELAYLRRTVINASHGHHRRLAVVRKHPDDPPGEAEAAEVAAIRRSQQDAVVAAVRTLPDRQRDCTVLRYYGGLAHAEIAEVLELTVGSVKTHLHRARTTLARELEGIA